PALQISLVTAGDETVDASDQRGLAATAGAGDEEQLAALQRQREVAERRLGASAVPKGEPLDRQWMSGVWSCFQGSLLLEPWLAEIIPSVQAAAKYGQPLGRNEGRRGRSEERRGKSEERRGKSEERRGKSEERAIGR